MRKFCERFFLIFFLSGCVIIGCFIGSAERASANMVPYQDFSHIKSGGQERLTPILPLDVPGTSDFRNIRVVGPDPWIDVTSPNYGAVGDVHIVTDAATGVGSTTIISATANFAPTDVGKHFSATPTKYSTTGQITGTITAQTATSITVSISSGTATTATSVRLTWGTDNTAAIQAAITASQDLCKGGDGNANNSTVPFDADCPVIFFPAPATGVGYLASGSLNITHQGMVLTTLGREGAAIYLDTAAAQLKFAAPSGTYHGLYMHGIALECNYVASTGLTLDSIEESEIDGIRANDCMAQGVNMTNSTGTNGLTTFYDLRESGNVVGVLNNSSQQTVFYHCTLFGATGNNTLVAVKMTGSHVVNEFNGCWMEGFFNFFLVDNTSAVNQTTFSIRDSRILSTVSEARFIKASSANVNNQLLLNAIVDFNEISLGNATNWNDLLINSNVAAGTGFNIHWTNNIRDAGPIAKVFNTDSGQAHIIYDNNNGVNGANIITGGGVLFGLDCGAEFQLGPFCTLRNNGNTVTFPSTTATLTQTVGSGTVNTAGTAVVNGTCQAQTAITVTGATATDAAFCSLNAAAPATWQTGIVLSLPEVTANAVTVRICNGTAASITPVAATVRCTVMR